MSTFAIQTEAEKPGEEKKITWETFQQEYLSREDGYKYEWLDGIVEKSPVTMDKTQLYILRNLQEFFTGLKFEGKVSGQLMAEADLFFLNNHRRPDICWLTDEQIDRLAEGEYEVPAFVMEIISGNDVMNRVFHKMQDYRAAGVQVVWHILPQLQEVHVYAGDNLGTMTVCSGEMNCSAEPALPEFQLAIDGLFAKSSRKSK